MHEAPAYDPWMHLSDGDTDPFFAGPNGIYCMASAPTGPYICTRSIGHDGYHVAAKRGGRVCCNSWGIAPHLRLPEGF